MERGGERWSGEWEKAPFQLTERVSWKGRGRGNHSDLIPGPADGCCKIALQYHRLRQAVVVSKSAGAHQGGLFAREEHTPCDGCVRGLEQLARLAPAGERLDLHRGLHLDRLNPHLAALEARVHHSGTQ